METISWTDYVRNKDALLTVKEQRNVVHTVNRGKSNWMGHILRRNCMLRHIIKGRI